MLRLAHLLKALAHPYIMVNTALCIVTVNHLHFSIVLGSCHTILNIKTHCYAAKMHVHWCVFNMHFHTDCAILSCVFMCFGMRFHVIACERTGHCKGQNANNNLIFISLYWVMLQLHTFMCIALKCRHGLSSNYCC